MPSVSDADAVQALLSSADASSSSQKNESNHKRRDRPHERQSDKRQRSDESASYYGPASSAAPDKDGNKKEESNTSNEPKQKPNFGLSGALMKSGDDKSGGRLYKGVVLKFQEPPEARTPSTPWRFYVFRTSNQQQKKNKEEEPIEVLHIHRQSAYLIGRNEDVADIPVRHPSCSSQHAVLQYRARPLKDDPGVLHVQPYLMDLESVNGTFLNGVQLESARYYQLCKGDVVKFGASSREYVLLAAKK